MLEVSRNQFNLAHRRDIFFLWCPLFVDVSDVSVGHTPSGARAAVGTAVLVELLQHSGLSLVEIPVHARLLLPMKFLHAQLILTPHEDEHVDTDVLGEEIILLMPRRESCKLPIEK